MTDPRRPFGKGWREENAFRGTVTWEHRDGASATSSYGDGEFHVSTTPEHEEFVRKAFGMQHAERVEYGDVRRHTSVLLTLTVAHS